MKEVKNRKTNVTILFMIATMIVVFALWYVFEKGNPLDANKLNKDSDVYLQQTYPDLRDAFERTTDAYFVRADISYLDKTTQTYIPIDGSWQVYYSRKDEPETYIYFVYDRDKNMIYDSCSDRYLKGGLIYERLSRQYNNYIADLYNDIYSDTPLHTTSEDNLMASSAGQAWFKNDVYSPAPWNTMYVPTHILFYEGPELNLYKEYTMEELAKEYGVIHFRYNDGISVMANHNQEQSKEDYLADYKAAIDNLYNHCLEIRDAVNKYNIPFKELCVTHGIFEGVYYMSREQLFSDDLYDYIYNNHTVF